MTPVPVTPFLKVKGNQIVTDDSQETPVLLRGAGLGGWMNMENVIQVTNVGLFPIPLPPPVPFFPTQQRITSTYDPALTFIG
ncbi:hypothetical protein QFC24_006662 [Naganishia onofrii]|uniref:Uncharacterized protein n=1 Tax=Naganishia onofrii TaxID=1851511 RepID=A0ACC2X137_9TREE|nr:hypothetical protein QFC24_006662 [Naganishia onofrii]